MRWLGIIALSLLALVPPCSSEGNQSITSVFPSVIPKVSNETDDVRSTLLNSTDITQADTEASPTASTAYPPVDNLTAVKRGLEEGTMPEQDNEIEYSSTDNTLELTPTRKDDEEVKNDEAASSQVDNVQPEPSRSRDIESQPQSAESPPAQATNSSDLENLSADELLKQLNAANATLEAAKKATAKAREELTKSEKAAEQPNQDYAAKKKKWEELEAVAAEKETADREYEEAQATLVDYLPIFTTAETDLELAKKELENFEKLKEELPKWPGMKLDAENEERTKKLEEQKLRNKVNPLQKTVNAKQREFTAAEKKVNETQKLYDQNNCDNPAEASSTTCDALRKSIAKLKGKTELAKTAYDQAASDLKSAKSDLENLGTELSNLRAEISRLNSNMQDLTTKFISDKIDELKEGLKGINENYENAKKKKEDAEAELEKKKTAKEAAEQTDGAISAEEARRAELLADAHMGLAKTAKDEADEKVKAQKKILENAEQKEAELKTILEYLEKAHAAALQKEEARKKEGFKTGSTPLPLILGLCIGGFVVLIGLGVGGFFAYGRIVKKGNGPDDRKKPKKEAKSRTPSTSATPGTDGKPLISDIQKTPAASATEKAATPAGSAAAPASPAAPAEAPAGPAAPAAAPPASPAAPAAAPSQNPAGTHVPVYVYAQVDGFKELQKIDITAFYPPGEEPYKIPAKHFLWKGALIRRSRWHGAPNHLLEGKKGPEKLEHIYFDKQANVATEIGPSEIVEDGGPPSDSSRSQYLNNLDEFEKGKAAEEAADKAKNEARTAAEKKEARKLRAEANRLWRVFHNREADYKKEAAGRKAARKAAGKKIKEANKARRAVARSP